MLLVVWLVLLQAAPPAPPRDARGLPASGSGIVGGVVLDEATGAPIAGARVTIRRHTGTVMILPDPQIFSAEATTGDDGSFELTNLPSGEFILFANAGEMRSSHLSRIYGQDGPGPFNGPSLELADHETKSGLRIPLTRALAIEGRVLNEFGEAMAEVSVNAIRTDGLGGSQSRDTDDRGRFRLFGLRAGKYEVCAKPGQSGMMRPTDGDGLRKQYDRSCVSDLLVKPGDPPDVLLQMQRTGAFTLSGTVVSATGAAVSEVLVNLRHLQGDWGRQATTDKRDGSFTARGLLPGDYLLSVSVGTRDESRRYTLRERAELTVRIDGADQTGLTLTTVPVASLSGRVVRDRRSRGPLPSSFTIQMVPPLGRQNQSFDRPPSASPGAGGAFELTGIFGSQLVSVFGLPNGWFVDSIRHGEDDITDQPREFRADDDRSVVIVLSDRSATLFARPVDAYGKLRTDAVVVLVPVDPARWKRMPLNRMAVRHKDGFFELAGQKPGEYSAAALTLTDLTRVSREFGTLEPLAKIGRRIMLEQGEPLRIDLAVTALEVNR
jgi:hypothetical protein